MSKYVNGPINCVRLKGKIGNIDKVIYLYFDIHHNIDNQTKCRDVKAIDLKNYLIEQFDAIKGTNRMIDMFLEVPPSLLVYNTNITKKKYIWEVTDMFRKLFNYDFHKKRILQNEQFPNVRFHYFDIRDMLKWGIDNIINQVDNTITIEIYEKHNFSKNMLLYILDGIKLFASRVTIIYNFLYGDRKVEKTDKHIIPDNIEILSKYTIDEKTNIGLNYMKKILDNFNNNKVKDAINKYILDELIISFNNIFDTTNKFIKYINSIIDTISKYDNIDNNVICTNDGIQFGLGYEKSMDISNNISKMYHRITTSYNHCFVYLVDIVSLRRFLDKDYITNCVLYSGAYHSNHYIYFLIKYFNFKITHYSHDGPDNDIIDKIKQSKIITDSNILCQFYGKKQIQCVDMSKFPPNFE